MVTATIYCIYVAWSGGDLLYNVLYSTVCSTPQYLTVLNNTWRPTPYSALLYTLSYTTLQFTIYSMLCSTFCSTLYTLLSTALYSPLLCYILVYATLLYTLHSTPLQSSCQCCSLVHLFNLTWQNFTAELFRPTGLYFGFVIIWFLGQDDSLYQTRCDLMMYFLSLLGKLHQYWHLYASCLSSQYDLNAKRWKGRLEKTYLLE